MPKIMLSIDPGAKGAIATFEDKFLVAMTRATPEFLTNLLLRLRGARVVLEQVNGAPGQSGPASFNFGKAYGELLGVCEALRVEPVLVRPADWKPALGLRREYGETTAQFKRRSLVMARDLWPEHASRFFKLAKDDGAAEAALLGHYALVQGIV
ncbi:MAG: hypothetical protein KGO96_12355 [Elusimicrobia bacterium]|nr:hypothetical protein [Elusimicrobiota bacterium]